MFTVQGWVMASDTAHNFLFSYFTKVFFAELYVCINIHLPIGVMFTVSVRLPGVSHGRVCCAGWGLCGGRAGVGRGVCSCCVSITAVCTIIHLILRYEISINLKHKYSHELLSPMCQNPFLASHLISDGLFWRIFSWKNKQVILMSKR